MKLNYVLITYKKPSKLRTASNKAETARLKKAAPHLFRQTHQQQESHLSTIKHIREGLRKRGIAHRVILRDRLQKDVKRMKPPADLIITVGGDGSVLAASHVAGKIPILGVNSLPKTSVGFFCSATAATFEKILKKIILGTYRPVSLPLLEVSIDGKKIPHLALNDILFAGESPAETVQYSIAVGRKKERQRSSGVWIAAGPGSTAGIQSAGGKILPTNSTRLQFLTREMCTIPGVKNKLKRGFAPPGTAIRIVSEMAQGQAFLDGVKFVYPVPRGSRLTVKVSARHLKIFL